MKRLLMLPVILGLSFAFTAGMANAQAASGTAGAAPLTREEVKRDREEFMRTHRWNPVSGFWEPLDVNAPAGMKSRAEVKAERDEFLRSHSWNPVSGFWEPLDKSPREMSKLSR